VLAFADAHFSNCHMRNEQHSFERIVIARALLMLLPCAIVLAYALYTLKWPLWQKGLAASVTLALTFFLTRRFVQQILYPINTASNLLEALREGDYTLRASARPGAFGTLVRKVNELSDTLKSERLRAEEAGALLNKVLDEVDVSVLAFDESGVLRLANRGACALFRINQKDIGNVDAHSLGLSEFLGGAAERVEPHGFPGGQGRFEVHRRGFRDRGREHQLLVMSDMTRALREEERGAWQRLIRVLGHELNNSLTPIRSMAQSLGMILARDPRPSDWEEDMRDGLGTIGDRAGGLSRFMTAYATLARLPPPKLRQTELAPLLRRAAKFDPRKAAELADGGEVSLQMDADQIDQVLINLVKNAVEAALVTQGGVLVRWQIRAKDVLIEILDEGTGLANSDNLFVPFFTTKPGGSGIGLVLARQIVEAHGGLLNLRNRTDRQGCVAEITLPLQPLESSEGAAN
jgi:two-component system, NtrC family, nitrogen regulation sensor histidine kinase NtrY